MRLIENSETRTLDIAFEAKPDRATIALLRAGSFRWNRERRVWSRALSDGAHFKARQIAEMLSDDVIPIETTSDSGDLERRVSALERLVAEIVRALRTVDQKAAPEPALDGAKPKRKMALIGSDAANGMFQVFFFDVETRKPEPPGPEFNPLITEMETEPDAFTRQNNASWVAPASYDIRKKYEELAGKVALLCGREPEKRLPSGP